jgi:hypothetical protein
MSGTFLGSSDGYSYHLEIIEDLDDGRLHDGDERKPRPYDDMLMAGIRESIPIHQVSKIFYTDTGRILNIGNNDERGSNPVLLLKRDVNAKSPITMRQDWFDEPEEGDESQHDTEDESSEFDNQDEVDRQLWTEAEGSADSPAGRHDSRATYLPPHLDSEWLALEVYVDDDGDSDGSGSDGDDDGEPDSGTEAERRVLIHDSQLHGSLSVDSKLMTQIQRISIHEESLPQDTPDQHPADLQQPRQDNAGSYVTRSPFGSIASSLSLMEMLIRLTSLQEFQQTSHLAIPDHILTFFLEETSTTGLQGEAHWRMRSEATRRMGFDPYTDTPQR